MKRRLWGYEGTMTSWLLFVKEMNITQENIQAITMQMISGEVKVYAMYWTNEK